MSPSALIDPEVAAALRCWHIAPAGRPGTVTLTGRAYFADGDGVTVLLRTSGGDALASDGGVMAARLADVGVDVWGPTRAATAWTETLSAFKLHEVDGRIVGRRPINQAAALASDISSAMLTTDGLRWLAAPERESKLVRQFYQFLDGARFAYDRRPTIELPRGAKVRPTARVNTSGRSVLVQAVGGTEQALEHALSLVQRIERANYAFDQRLVLLKGDPTGWPPDHLDLLADHAPVGFSDRMDQVGQFLKKGTPLARPVPADL
ncbi:hypothetical protein [Streptomyces coelicoflavus]|uniref:DUF1828 domain-containing protein n=1 Tax=Streptomyces coelicoflavus TaxID=285562 RepID=A0A6N9V0F3_9ACTN|nr:hypothetical protein [Streptomyces coelicoflavus]NEB18749.1 hypothetical protein [Streptomyces coelicoflavus]NEB20742.1 hypothetical protein [Streptomyces coelicoflavus]